MSMNFKVGDKVKAVDHVGDLRLNPPGSTHTITSISPCGGFLRFFEEPYGWARTRFELVEEPKTPKQSTKRYIVAVLTDTTPEINLAKGGVYQSREEAEGIALKLAEKNTGKTYSVLETVSEACTKPNPAVLTAL